MRQETAFNSIPRQQIKRFLNSLGRYVILRNHDIWESLERGGDLDILVEDLYLAERSLNDILGKPLFQIRRSYVKEYFFEWGRIDLLSCIEWRGAVFLDSKSLFDEARCSELGFLKPRIDHEAVVSWLSSLLFGGFFKERYKPTILKAAAENLENLKQSLIYAAGKIWGTRLLQMVLKNSPEKSRVYLKEIRRAVRLQSLARAPVKTVYRFTGFCLAELNIRLSPPVPWVAVLGPDGSGKTSMLTEFSREFSTRFSGVQVHHWRPGVLLPPDSEGGPCTNPHGQPARGAVSSVIKICFLWLDWMFGYWKQLVHLRAKGYLLFFDRHFVDMLIDPRRYRYGGPTWLIRFAGFFIPQPDLYILLDAPADVLQSRKQEVPFEETSRQRKDYLRLVRRMPNGEVVDASKSLHDVANQVFRLVVDKIALSKYGG